MHLAPQKLYQKYKKLDLRSDFRADVFLTECLLERARGHMRRTCLDEAFIINFKWGCNKKCAREEGEALETILIENVLRNEYVRREGPNRVFLIIFLIKK